MAIDHRNITRIKNQKLVLQQLFNNHETSRAEIARKLDLNKSTVSSIYTDLNKAGFIEEVRQGESSSNGGRKPSLIRLNRNYGFVASFNIGTSHLTSMFNYVNGEVIQYDRQVISKFDILSIMQTIKQKITELQRVNQTQHGLLAICLAIHGIVFNNKVQDSPFLTIDGIDLQKYFEQEFAVPVLLENEANLSAIFEQDFCTGSDIQNLITISIHKGIGLGIIANGTIYRGNRGMAGEIGRALVHNLKGELVKAESLCSEDVIFQHVMDSKGLKVLDHDQLRQLYLHDPQVQKIVNRDLDRLAVSSYNAIVSFGPQEVFFNSGMLENIPEMFKLLQKKLVKMGTLSPIKMIRGSRWASLLGASSLAIHQALEMNDYWLKFRKPEIIQNVD